MFTHDERTRLFARKSCVDVTSTNTFIGRFVAGKTPHHKSVSSMTTPKMSSVNSLS